MDSTSVSLLNRLQEPTCDTAWARFVELYAPLIFHWGLGQGLSQPDAADLVQEVFTILVVKLPDFHYNPAQRFRGWLRTITVNRARDLHRRDAARPDAHANSAPVNKFEAQADELFEEAEYRSYLVNRALDLMQSEFNEETWQACWLVVVEGQSASEVAEKLGLSINSVYLAKSRVLKRLREELDGLID